MPGVLKSRLRYARRFSSVHSTLTDLKRFSQVPLDSSAARMPLPLATMAAAVLESSSLSMRNKSCGGDGQTGNRDFNQLLAYNAGPFSFWNQIHGLIDRRGPAQHRDHRARRPRQDHAG